MGTGLAVGVGEAGSPELVTSGRFFRGDLTTSAAILGTSSRLDLTLSLIHISEPTRPY